MDENISRAAGAAHGQELDDADFREIVDAASVARSRSAPRSTAGSRPRASDCGRRPRRVHEPVLDVVPVTLRTRETVS